MLRNDSSSSTYSQPTSYLTTRRVSIQVMVPRAYYQFEKSLRNHYTKSCQTRIVYLPAIGNLKGQRNKVVRTSIHTKTVKIRSGDNA